MSELGAIMVLAIIGSFFGLIGGIIIIYNKKLRGVLSKYSIPFAAGILVTVALMGILPEAVDMAGESVFSTMLYSFMGAYLFEHLLFSIHHHERGEKGVHFDTAVPLVIVGDTIHNFIDGVAIAATYIASPGLGVITAISTFLHEVPHEVGDFGILLKAGLSNSKVILINLFSACATIFGALIIYYVPQNNMVIGHLLAIAGGLFLYLGATDFLPHIHDVNISKNKAMASLVIGVILMVSILSIIPHAHPNQLIDVPVPPSDVISEMSEDVDVFSPR